MWDIMDDANLKELKEIIDQHACDPVKMLDDEELKELKKIYDRQIPFATHISGMINTYFKWKKIKPEQDYMQFVSLGNDWKTSGTFLMKFLDYDLMLFTLDETGEKLYSLLLEVDLFEPNHRWVIYGLRNEHLSAVHNALSDLGVSISKEVPNWCYWLPKENVENLKTDCPNEVYIDKLNQTHIPLICKLWPHAFDGADKYLSIFVELNDAYGVFLKSNNKLVTWIMMNHWGALSVLETVPEFKRKGYGSLVTRKMCKTIAQEGNNPYATIVCGNSASESMFRKLGFEHIGNCTYVIL